MKIIVIGTAWPYKGGLASYNERLVQELSLNNQVEIFTFTLQYPNFLFPGKSQYSDDTPPTRIQIMRLINSVNPLNWVKAGRILKKRNPDLIIIKYWLPFMGPCFGTMLRIAKRREADVKTPGSFLSWTT